MTINFADAAVSEWLELHDDRLPATTVRAKIERKEYIVARIGVERIGFLRFSLFWSAVPYIDIVAVEAVHQRKGVGRTMVEFLEAHARTSGQHILLSSSQVDEPDAQAWHRRIGFRQAGLIEDFGPLQKAAEIIFIKEIDAGVAR